MIENVIVFWLWGMVVCLAVLSVDEYIYAWRYKVRIHPRISHLFVSSVMWSWIGVALIVCDWLIYLREDYIKRNKKYF